MERQFKMKTRLQFSLWSMLVLIVVSSIGLAAWRHRIERFKKIEKVLFNMRRGELFVRGITAIDGDYWSIAWSSDSVEDGDAIHSALDDAGDSAFGSFSRGRGGWYVHRTDFFRAQIALKRSDTIKQLGIKIVEPDLGDVE